MWGNQYILVVGDFNYPEHNWGEGEPVAGIGERNSAPKFLECTRDVFFTQHVKQPTRHRLHQILNFLDLVFSNEDGMVNDVEVGESLGKSDHSVVTFSFTCETSTATTSTKNSCMIVETTIGCATW